MLDLGLATESRGDAAWLRLLIDRSLIEQSSWLGDQISDGDRGSPRAWEPVLSQHRRYRGLDPGSDFFDIHEVNSAIKALSRSTGRRLRIHGRIKDGGADPGEDVIAEADAHFALKILRLFEFSGARPDVVIIARDTDRELARVEGFRQACRSFHRGQPSFRFIAAIAHPEIEAWAIAGFEAEGSEEKERHKRAREELGFDPVLKPEDLTAKNPTDKKDAKRILGLLTDSDAERASRCLLAPFAALRRRGEGCGLANVLSQVEKKILPLIG